MEVIAGCMLFFLDAILHRPALLDDFSRLWKPNRKQLYFSMYSNSIELNPFCPVVLNSTQDKNEFYSTPLIVIRGLPGHKAYLCFFDQKSEKVLDETLFLLILSPSIPFKEEDKRENNALFSFVLLSLNHSNTDLADRV
jgi:hypothetical protein